MGHNIRGFVARPETLEALRARFPAAKLIGLDAGFAFVPATPAVMAAIDAADPAGEDARMGDTIDFVFDHPVMLRALTELSRVGPIALVETDYFGGLGSQAATACVDGEVASSKEGEPEGEARPINKALRAIGVVRAPDEDEFDTVCLGQYRRMDDFESPGVTDNSRGG